MPFTLIRQDITRMEVDAIVNAANNRLAQGGGVCGAIFAAAGAENLTRACRAIGRCETGQAVITPGFALPARYVIHTVGPVWQGGERGEAAQLRSCYLQSLRLAARQGCHSVAFPLISSGIYGYPKGEALAIAASAIRSYLNEEGDLDVYLALFDRGAFRLSEGLLGEVQSYIDDHYVDEHRFARSFGQDRGEPLPPSAPRPAAVPMAAPPGQSSAPASAVAPTRKKRSLRDLLFHLDESFSRMLLRLIDEKGMTDVQVYKRANLDRKLFSKLRKEGYNPSRQTAIALAVALKLNLDETRDLLSRAGYSLSRCSKFDVIIEYFITEGIYDIDEINQVLFAFDQKLLGGGSL